MVGCTFHDFASSSRRVLVAYFFLCSTCQDPRLFTSWPRPLFGMQQRQVRASYPMFSRARSCKMHQGSYCITTNAFHFESVLCVVFGPLCR